MYLQHFIRHALCIGILPSTGNYTPSHPYNQHLDLQQVILSFFSLVLIPLRGNHSLTTPFNTYTHHPPKKLF